MRVKVDITLSYQAWYQVGQALANEFGEGEGARNYFHQLSQFHPNYRASKTDGQFTACLKATIRTNYTLDTIRYWLQQAGVSVDLKSG